jgi:peroxygenase
MLQDHVAFFDSDNDGIIWPVDTFHGFQKLGFDAPTAVIQALAIHLPNSFKTLPPGKFIDPRFPIYVEYIHKAKHGSDTGSFSKTGTFVKEKFEEIWIR